MSNTINDQLLERARVACEYFEGKLPEKLITEDIKNNNLACLAQHVKEAEDEIFQLEYQPTNVGLEVF